MAQKKKAEEHVAAAATEQQPSSSSQDVTPPPTADKATDAPATTSSQSMRSSRDIFAGESPIPKKTGSHRESRKRQRSPSLLSTKSEEDISLHKSEQVDSDDQEDDLARAAYPYEAADLRALAAGRLTFDGNDRVGHEMRNLARKCRKQWDQMSVKTINTHLNQLSHTLARKKHYAAADQVDNSE